MSSDGRVQPGVEVAVGVAVAGPLDKGVAGPGDPELGVGGALACEQLDEDEAKSVNVALLRY